MLQSTKFHYTSRQFGLPAPSGSTGSVRGVSYPAALFRGTRPNDR